MLYGFIRHQPKNSTKDSQLNTKERRLLFSFSLSFELLIICDALRSAFLNGTCVVALCFGSRTMTFDFLFEGKKIFSFANF